MNATSTTERAELGGTARLILNAIKRRGQATVTELSGEFSLSGMAVRHHLATLRAKGLASSSQSRRGVGRPTEVFHLTERSAELFPQQYDRLANDILGTLESLGCHADEVFDARTRRKLEQHSQQLTGLPLEERVSVLAGILSDEGFLAEYERQGEEFVLTEHNCAVSKVAQQYQQMCQCELELIAQLLDANVERRQHMISGDFCCSYVIRPKSEPTIGSETRPTR